MQRGPPHPQARRCLSGWGLGSGDKRRQAEDDLRPSPASALREVQREEPLHATQGFNSLSLPRVLKSHFFETPKQLQKGDLRDFPEDESPITKQRVHGVRAAYRPEGVSWCALPGSRVHGEEGGGAPTTLLFLEMMWASSRPR